jgi:tRNA nucleotidyltransferase (CCA-adding enzyme)
MGRNAPVVLCYNISMGRDLSGLLKRSLDGPRLELLYLLAYQASMLKIPLYLVGGVVRDLMLGRDVNDLDLVLEGNSAEFAEYIVRRFGGKILVHPKFGTASWVPNESTFRRLNESMLRSPAPLSFDLVSARSETYEYPGALPTVQRSGIDDDLRRRDFTINAIALRLDGEPFGELIDPLGGELDLAAGLIRVLHERSFLDDPTRMFRAVRYAVRYGFDIAPETLILMNEQARVVLSQLSGERLRHEFDLIFEEEHPVPMLEQLQAVGLLRWVHAALQNADARSLTVSLAKPEEAFGEFIIPDILSFRQALGWVLYLLRLTGSDIEAIGKRLSFPSLLTKAVREASSFIRSLDSLQDMNPSLWTFRLDEIPTLSVYAVWLVTSEASLKDYLITWRQIKPYTTGYTLQQRGLPPGPRYREILSRLRAAWLDGEVTTEEEELKLLSTLL